MATRIKMRNDTAANWLAINPILAKGELGFLIENGQASNFKIGDGLTAFQSLTYVLGSDIDLSNVDNTSDLDKPVSTLQQTALNLKAGLGDSNTFSGLVNIFENDLQVTNLGIYGGVLDFINGPNLDFEIAPYFVSGDTIFGGINTTSGSAFFAGKVTASLFNEGETYLGIVVSSATITILNGSHVTAQLTASTACTFAMPMADLGLSFILYLKQASSVGNGTATFTDVIWSNGVAPVITATAGKMDIISFVSGPNAAGNGYKWYGSFIQNVTPN